MHYQREAELSEEFVDEGFARERQHFQNNKDLVDQNELLIDRNEVLEPQAAESHKLREENEKIKAKLRELKEFDFLESILN